MSDLEDVKVRIKEDWQQLSITSLDYHRFIQIANYLGHWPATTTHMVSVTLRCACAEARKHLRKMERMGYVAADTNGSNSIRWKILPCSSST